MCGLDVDDSGSGEDDKDEDVWTGDGVKMLPPPLAHSGGSSMWGSRRSRCGCLAHGVLLLLWNLCVVSASAALLALVFAAVLSPALLLLYAGFLCHSRVSRVHAAGLDSPVRDTHGPFYLRLVERRQRPLYGSSSVVDDVSKPYRVWFESWLTANKLACC